MATQQDQAGVPFSIAHNLQQFRLLELPPELLELIDSPNPPPLCVKSQAPPASSSTSDSKPAYAVLCTPSKTFHLRQVQTSNSVFVTQPALEAQGDDIPLSTTRAIASCTATLELHPVDASSVAYLEHVLPVYDIIDGEVDGAGIPKSKAAIFRDIPLSDAQCEDSWAQLLAFEFGGTSWRPSANTALKVWKSIIQVAVAEGYKLDKQFLVADIVNALDDEGYPAGLVAAILQRLSSSDQDNAESWSCLDRTKTVQWVGKTLLDARLGSDDYLMAVFTETWKDHLPEFWRGDAELEAIEGEYLFPSSTTIRTGKMSSAKNASEATASKTASSSRKWHEKFSRARKR